MGKRIVKDATVHEKTVQAAHDGLAVDSTRPRRKSREHQPDLRVVHTKMHDEVWSTALALADGDSHRIQRLSDEDVIVHNNRAWRNA